MQSGGFFGGSLLALRSHFDTIHVPMSKQAQALSVSIVIPVYNDEDHLKRCLRFIAKQTDKPDEVIIVDNNSTDGSAAVAKQFDFVRVISESQQGVLHARNTGFNAAKGDVIGRIDADTQLGKNWVKRVRSIFTQTDIDAVSGPVGYHDAPGKRLTLFAEKKLRKLAWRVGTRDDAVFLFGSNMAVRRSAWLAVRDDICLRRDVHEDVDLAIHLYNAGFSVALDEDLPASVSSRRFNDSRQAMKKYLAVYQNTFAVHGISSPAISLTPAVLLTTHFGVKLFIKGYNKKTKRFSVKSLLDNTDVEVRDHPM